MLARRKRGLLVAFVCPPERLVSARQNFVNEVSRNKVAVPEGVAGMIQIISVS